MHPEFFKHLSPKGLAWLAVFFTRVVNENGYPKPGDVQKLLLCQNLVKIHSFHPAIIPFHCSVSASSCLNESCCKEYLIELMNYSLKIKQDSDVATAHAIKLLP